MYNLAYLIKSKIKYFYFLLTWKYLFCEFHQFPFNNNKPLGENAWLTMAKCCKIIEQLDIPYRITDGTVLGLYRQGDFIAHDNDIDVDILDCDNADILQEAMLENGLRLGRKVIYRHRIQQLVYFDANEAIFDIVFWYSEGSRIYNYSEKGYVRIQDKRFFENVDYFEYKGKQYPIPSNIEEWLVMRFGADWKIPKTYKDDWKKECGDIRTL